MESIVITSVARTALGKIGGSLKDVLPEVLSAVVIREAVRRSNIEKGAISEVILGQTKQSADAPNIARVASLKAGVPEQVPAYTVHRQCASGMQAIINGAMQIGVGYADIIVAGGVESMSTAQYYIRKGRYGYGSGNGEIIDSNTESQPKSQPEDIYGRFNMGITAENVAEKYSISREQQDAFAYRSQVKAIVAIDSGKFKDEIVSVEVKKGKEKFLFQEDEYPKRDVSLERMSQLKPVFKDGGTVTAGNSSGRNDGAAAIVMMNETKAAQLNIKPLARFVAAGATGVDPRYMGIGPVPATKLALARAGLSIQDIGLFELNEAFAAQSVAVMQELGINPDILNVNGGAIALGHPLGCSGARISITLIQEMIRRKVKYGLATICVAGGLGVSIIYENMSY